MSSIDIQVNAILNRKQTVVVDSSRRTSGASENFTFTLPEIIKNVKNIRPVEVIMSNKLYNITGQTNLLEIYRDGVNIAIAIPSGNYDIDSLMLALNTIWNPQNISFTYTPATLKVRVEDTMGIPFQLTANSTILQTIGFTVNYNLSIVNIQHESDSVVTLQNAYDFVNIHLSLVRQYYGSQLTDFLVSVPISQIPFASAQKITFDPQTYIPSIRSFFNSFEMSVRDKQGNVIDNNRADMIFVFEANFF